MKASQSTIYLDGEMVEKVSGSYSNAGYHNAHLGYSYDGAGYSWFKGLMDEFHDLEPAFIRFRGAEPL